MALVALLAVVGVTTAAKHFVHVVDESKLGTVGTRFVFSPPFQNVTSAIALAKCHSLVVRDGSSESDNSASLHFGFDESFFRRNGFRLCALQELSTVTALTTLPDGNYVTHADGTDDELTTCDVENGRVSNCADEVNVDSTEHYEDSDKFAICCSAAQI